MQWNSTAIYGQINDAQAYNFSQLFSIFNTSSSANRGANIDAMESAGFARKSFGRNRTEYVCYFNAVWFDRSN